jgi:hypothetical protein
MASVEPRRAMGAPTGTAPSAGGLHIFWDGNNILGGAERTAKESESEPGFPYLRVYFKNLLDVVRSGRHPLRAWMSGSIPPPEDGVWAYATGLGIRLDLSRRTADGREGLLDQTLRERMLSTEFDFPERGAIALMTGDGAGWESNEGFFANLKRLKARGWAIELYSWRCNVNGNMRRWVESNGKYVELDRWYRYVTFVVDGSGCPPRVVSYLPPPPYH